MTAMIVESTINKLVDEFIGHPYLFFTEADAVARFHQILTQQMGDNQFVHSQDGYKISLIHREFPTFFRFSDKDPTERLPSSGSRGHYDTVILTPEFIQTDPAESVHNRSIYTYRDERITPFQAVIEFKLDNRGWSAGRAAGVVAELGKLRLSHEAPLRYFVVLMRYQAPAMTRWQKYWPVVQAAAKDAPEIMSVFAINWLRSGKGHNVFRFGQWKSE